MYVAVGERIRTTRESLRLSRAEAARRAGIDLNYLWRLETGRCANPGTENLRKIAVALECPVSELLGEDIGHTLTPLQVRWLSLLDILPPQRVPDAYAEVARLAADPDFDPAMILGLAGVA